MSNLYHIVFEDNTSVSNGTVEEPKWLDIPNKNIRSIFYSIPTGDLLCLSGFKRIYHYGEAVTDLNGTEAGKKKIEFTHLIIERNDKFIQYRINQITTGIEINILPKDSDYIKKLNPIGWRNGV
jgi:hypothetical protein